MEETERMRACLVTVSGSTLLFKSKNNNDTKRKASVTGFTIMYVQLGFSLCTLQVLARPGESSVLIYKTD